MRNALACALLMLLCFAAALGQAAGGGATISGVVRDPSGASVPNADVVILDEGWGVIRTLSTNEAGVFTVPALVPGTGCKVAVTASGFSDYETRDLELRVGQILDLKITLKVATTAVTVEVTSAPPLVEYAKTDFSAIVDTRQIQVLPINGRRVERKKTPCLLETGLAPSSATGFQCEDR